MHLLQRSSSAGELIEYSPRTDQQLELPTMKSLVRFLIGFVLVYQLTLLANCKVIKQQQGHEKEISGSEANYERSNETTNISATLSDSREELHKTSINYTNTTSASLSGSDIKSLTHM